jgi:release factor glutamine methyltransferase
LSGAGHPVYGIRVNASKNAVPATSLRAVLTRMTRRFAASAVDSPRLSAELLLAESLGLDRSGLLKRLILNPESPVPEAALANCESLARRRASGEPAAYILGRKEFYGRTFAVSPACLVPRPETELLVDLAIRFMRGNEAPGAGLFADFGTGSGCIAVTLALEMPAWQGFALDNSVEALRLAARNAALLAAPNLAFALADFTRPPLGPSSLHLLLSNPPYVSQAEYEKLDPEVRRFEPKSALVPAAFPHPFAPSAEGSATEAAAGLEAALSILASAAVLLRPGGLLLLEMGCAQAKNLRNACVPDRWTEPAAHRDLAGLDRVLAVRKKGCSEQVK